MRFRVLGPVVAENDHGLAPLGPARQRTVLAVLLTEPGAVISSSQMVDRVWGAAPPQRARQILHTYLSRLRSVLTSAGGPSLARHSHGYALEVEPPTVDLHQFRALAAAARQATDDEHALALWDEALGWWRGTPYADLDSDWLRGVAVGLEAERLAAYLDRNDVWLRRGDHARLLPGLSTTAAEHPLDERLAEQLILALYRSGRQADALAHYRLVKDRLVEELGSDPGRELRELHQRILRQDPELAPTAPTVVADRPEQTAAPGVADAPAVAAPAQLPADIGGFTGRADALRQLDALLGPADTPSSTVVITAIGGSGGIGKTTLAVHWAHRVRHRFPDGQLYLNLRGFDPGGQAMRPAEALRTLLELLQVPPDRIPATAEAQAGLYRSRLAGARTLVVLDNARDADQVRPLLPGSPGSMVLITSRNQLTGLLAAEGARPVRLDVLDDDESRALLAGRLGAERVAAEPDAVDEIINACAGLPLALAIVAARAATQPTFPLAAFAAELADAGGRLDALAGPDTTTDVRAVFSWSYQALGAPAARLFRLLGLHPGPDIGLDAAASLVGQPAPRTRRLLVELTSAHLLAEPTPGRYAFHDLLRAYAADLVDTSDSDADRSAARRRMLDYYLHSAFVADRWLPTGRPLITLSPAAPGVTPEEFPGNAEARLWLTTELPILLAIMKQASTAGFDRHVLQLAWTLVTFLLWEELWHHQITVQDAGLAAARRLGDLSGQAATHRRLANAYTRLGRPDRARGHLERSLALCQQIGDHTGLARTYLVLAWLYAEQERSYQDGLRHAQQCLEAARMAEDRFLQALARNAIGWCHTLLGEHQPAIDNCEQALAELTALGTESGMPDVWSSLGHAHHHLGHHQQAIRYYQLTVDRCREVGDRRLQAIILERLGEVHRDAGHPAAAREAWQGALAIFDEVGHPDAEDLRKRLESLPAESDGRQ